MCSVSATLKTKINKDLTNIVREYLLPIKTKIIISSNPYNNEFLKQCYLLQMKRTFPQKHYNILKEKCSDIIEFKIPYLNRIRWNNTYIFAENQHIDKYLLTGMTCMYFIINDK